MLYDRIKLLRRHSVHPSTNQANQLFKTSTSKGPYGSWCTPDNTPKHATLTTTNSNVESKTDHKDDTTQKTDNSIIPIPKVRLFSFISPSKTPMMDKIKASITELKEVEKSPPTKKPLDESAEASQNALQLVETPQSPVPSSPRNEKCSKFKLPTVFDPFVPIDPQGRGYITWLFLVTFCYSYNAWCIMLRASFPYQTPANTPIWMTADYFCDLVYLLDVCLVKPRLMFLQEGFWVDDPTETRKNYRKKVQYKFDVISLLPLDIFYLYFGTKQVILRLPRLLKLQTFWEFHQAVDRVLSTPYVVRIGKTLFYIFYLIHLNACAYYAMSDYIGLASNGWVYDNQGNAYIRCFYFATKTATSIGKNPKPENTGEYLFMTGAWLMGVFVFALLIGQIRDIIATATRAKTEYRKMVDGCRRYLRGLNMPASVQRQVTCWYSYTWSQHRWFDESKILNVLPYNMKLDVALEVHMSTLSKVQLFRDCSASLLRDLVLQLRPVGCLPGDVVVRRGDVGHQMYIVRSGECLVMSADEQEVLARLGEGSVFGEVSLLGLPGLRRRTATVRSRGYSILFALSKNDLDAALKYHNEAAQILRLRADQIIRDNAARQTKQRLEETRKASEDMPRRRRSAVSGDSVADDNKRTRSGSTHSRRKRSSLYEQKMVPRAQSGDSSVASECRALTPVPKIVLPND